MSATPCMVTYNKFRKLVQYKGFANIYDDVASKSSNCPIFPRRIKLQYEDDKVNYFIDLDSQLDQLDQHKSTGLNEFEKEKCSIELLQRDFFSTVSAFFSGRFSYR